MSKLRGAVLPDSEIIRLGRFFFQADVAHVVLLHAKAMKSGFTVNGRKQFSPWTFYDLPPPSHEEGDTA